MTQPAVERGADPVQSLIDGNLPGGFALRCPIKVEVWREGEEYVAVAPDLLIHSFGANADEAVAQLRQDLVDQLRRLEELGDRLAPRMVAQRDRLRRSLTSGRA